VPEHPEEDWLKQALGPKKDCLSLEALEMCAGENAPVEFGRHLSSCAHCRAELALFRSFHEGPRDAAEIEATARIADRLHSPRSLQPEAAPSPRRSWWQVRWLGPGAAAVAAALIIGAVGLEWRHRGAPPIDVSTGAEDTLRSGGITLISPRGDITEAPAQIQWQVVAGAARYEIKLLEVDHTVLWSGSTGDSRIEIPQTARSQIVPAKTLLLQVRAVDSAGRIVAESELSRFRLLQNVYR
jgi:hypothetical protein